MNSHPRPLPGGSLDRPRRAQGAGPGRNRESQAVTLAELVSCLQDLTEDDELVVAALADFMARGRLKTRAAKKGLRRPAA